MLWITLFLSLSILPSVATAAPLPVQSGEHEGFTRIVAQVPNGSSWDVAHIGQTVTLTLPADSDGFDTSNVFNRIARDRIATIKGDASSLVLTLDCTCRISTFPSGPDYAVIDVADPGVALPTPLVEIANAQPLEEQPEISADPRTAEEPAAPAPVLPLIVTAPPPKQPPPSLNLNRTALNDAQQAALAEIQSQLAEELGAATTRGLLAPSADVPRRARAQIDVAEFDVPAPPPAPVEATPDPLSNMRISSSMDMPFAGQNSGAGVTREGLSCPKDADIAIETWGDPETFDQQISAGRSALFGEFDRINPDAVLDLARSYLYFGFGAEARQILALAPDMVQDQRLLFDLADIMDHGRLSQPETLQMFADCSSDIALWAIIAQDDRPNGSTLPVSTALRTLNKMPAHLRRFLAPHLSRRLLKHGYDEAAATALRSIERLPDSLSTEAQMAQAQIALKEGKTDTGATKLETIVEENTAQSPKALIALIDTRLAAGQPISFETASLVEAYAQEHRDTALGDELQRAHLMALVKSRQFDRAIAEISALNTRADPEVALPPRMALLRELTASADDIVFLDHILQQPVLTIARLDGPDKFDLAARLLSLGFAAEAQGILATEPESARPARRQLLAAKAALALDQPFQAQAALLGVEDPAVASLRAQAKAMAGDFDEADDLFRQSNLPAPARNAAWLAEDWRDRTPADAPVYGPTAQLAASQQPVSDDPAGMLTRTAAALAESAAARDTLSDLLAATAISTLEDQ